MHTPHNVMDMDASTLFVSYPWQTKEKMKRSQNIPDINNAISPESNIIEVHDPESSRAYIEILSPIQLTLECCRGISDADFTNILMLSPEQSFFYRIDSGSSVNKFNARQPHRHNFFELMIILDGEISQQIEGNDYLYRAGACCVINRNIKHREKFHGSARVLFIGMSAEFISQLISEQTEFYFQNENFNGNSVFDFLKDNMESEEMKNYLDIFPSFQNQHSIVKLRTFSDYLLRLMMFPTLGATYGIKNAICSLFSYLNDKNSFHATPVRLHTGSDLLLFSRVSHLLEDTDGCLTRADLAALLNYSGNYINTVVKRYSGKCLYDYSLTFSLKKAAELIRNSDSSISSIATGLNFSNRTHFYHLFKRRYGVTPGEYRKSVNSQCSCCQK